MLKLFNRKKKDNKGFTLVELVIVIAILAILVGLLAPQYTKYVEKSRKTADANNLEEIVKEIKVVGSDPQYSVPAGTFTITMSHTDGTTITFEQTANTAVSTSTTELWTAGMATLLEDTKNWTTVAGKSMTNKTLKLKSNKWSITTGEGQNAKTSNDISATIAVETTGTMTVTYSPANIKEGIN